MTDKSKKLSEIVEDGQVVGYMFYCPGCELYHAPYVKPFKNSREAGWNFNGDLNKPTFTPSIRSRTEIADGRMKVCHLFLTDGKLHFLGDCTHNLVNQIVELKAIDD